MERAGTPIVIAASCPSNLEMEPVSFENAVAAPQGVSAVN
jgi:hypothetical protein